MKKKKIWSSALADKKFREYIRSKYSKCVKCGSKDGLQVSHFFSRNKSSTRYIEDNVCLLCYPCHYGNQNGWEYHKSCCYKEFMIKRLGEKKYKELDRLAHTSVSRREAILELINLLGK